MELLYLAVGLLVGFIAGRIKESIIAIPTVSSNPTTRGKKPPVLINGRWIYQAEDKAQ